MEMDPERIEWMEAARRPGEGCGDMSVGEVGGEVVCTSTRRPVEDMGESVVGTTVRSWALMLRWNWCESGRSNEEPMGRMPQSLCRRSRSRSRSRPRLCLRGRSGYSGASCIGGE